MSISIFLNILLGLFLAWTLLSLSAMQIQEWVAARLKWRSRMLEKSLGKMFTDVTLVDQFYNHPLIRSLYTGKQSETKPSYIPSSEFSQAMIDILAATGTEASLLQQQLYKLYGETRHLSGKKKAETRRRLGLMLGMTRKALVDETGEEATASILAEVKNELLTLGQDFPSLQEDVEALFDLVRDQKQQINDALVKLSFKQSASSEPTVNRIQAGVTALSITHPQLKQTMSAMLNAMPQTLWQKENELSLVRTNIEDWFNNAMNRLTGWYKRRCLVTTLFAGLLIASLANIDSINLTTRLWREPDLRTAVLEKIEYLLAGDLSTEDATRLAAIQEELSTISLPVGWVGTPLSLKVDDSADLGLACTLFPTGEDQLYGLHIAGQCYPLINTPPVWNLPAWGLKLLGLFVSGVAASPGASFWFDMLKKVVNVRLTGLKPGDSTSLAGGVG